jgi:inorganic phosphate transporter, PiT family
MEVLVLVLVLALAAANGANDVPKGVATLSAAGVAKIRTAVVWGTITTAIGCLVSLTFAAKMTALFSKGIVSAAPTPAFAVAVLTGTSAWVAFATWRRLPVSTTHALVGSLLGAGVLFASSSVNWGVLLNKVVGPLLLSVLCAYIVSIALTFVGRYTTGKAAKRSSSGSGEQPKAVDSGGGASSAATAVATESASQESVKPKMSPVILLHWATSGFTSFARGMNDAPKIVAIGSFALIGGMTTTGLLFGVTFAMAIGGLIAGSRIAKRLSVCVENMTHVEGFTANLTTAALVGLGAFQGLPMSTTQVSVGAIAGTAGTDYKRIKGKSFRDFGIAWLVTPPFAAAVAALTYLIAG